MAKASAIFAKERPRWMQLVVSALSDVTNLLLDSARQATQGNSAGFPRVRDDLRQMHAEIAQALIPAEEPRHTLMAEIDSLLDVSANLCEAISVLDEATPRALDAITSLGERMCAHLMPGALNILGLLAVPVEASRLIATDDHFQDAHPDFSATTRQAIAGLQPLFERGALPVVPGFIGAAPDGTITAIGRGGLAWLAGQRGLESEVFLKPSPVHVLAALAHALGNPLQEGLALSAGLALDREVDAKWWDLDRGEIYVIEDSITGYHSGQSARDLLCDAGIRINLHLIGISPSQSKQQALMTAGAERVFEDLNAALGELII